MEPKSGLTITSPSARKAAIASSALSQTIVSGVGSPHCSSRAEVQNLSTVRSMARAGFTTRTPRSDKRWRASMRKTICSREPAGMIRGSTTSARSSSAAPLLRPGRPPSDAVSPSYGTRLQVCPRAASARVSSWVCHPSREARMTAYTRYLVSTAVMPTRPPSAKFLRSSPTFLKPGVARPFFRSAIDLK